MIIHTGSSRGGRVLPTYMYVCLSVYPHDMSKTDAARIIKLDKEMLHDESWKKTFFWRQ